MGHPTPPLRVERFADARAFRAVAEPLLLATEALDNLPLGLIGRVEAGAYRGAYLALVRRGDAPAAAALRTPPHRVILSAAADPEVARAVAADLLRDRDAPGAPGAGLTGVLGARPAARAFADAWTAATGSGFRLAMEQGVYRLGALRPPEGVPGRTRSATPIDLPLATEWFAAFDAEAGTATPGFDPAATAEGYVLGGVDRHLYLREVDGEPVAMAGRVDSTERGVRIAAVYTPPEHRRRGYAAALVADAARIALDEGRSECFLFTDLRNPTSNGVYRRIGFEEVGEVDALDVVGG